MKNIFPLERLSTANTKSNMADRNVVKEVRELRNDMRQMEALRQRDKSISLTEDSPYWNDKRGITEKDPIKNSEREKEWKVVKTVAQEKEEARLAVRAEVIKLDIL